jgi:predicted esterase
MPTPPRFDTSAAPAPHGGGLVLVAPRAHHDQGESAVAAAIYLHGRGASAQDILSLHDEFATPRLLGFAPEAAGNSWYPYSFLAPIHENAAGIDSAHAVIELLIKQCAAQRIPAERVALVGFSQGACLALDHAWRFPRRYGAIIAFTGAIIVDHRDDIGDKIGETPASNALAGTPVFLGANDPDPYIPWQRVESSARALTRAGSLVTLRRYPGRPHGVFADEIAEARPLLDALS